MQGPLMPAIIQAQLPDMLPVNTTEEKMVFYFNNAIWADTVFPVSAEPISAKQQEDLHSWNVMYTMIKSTLEVPACHSRKLEKMVN